MAAGDHSTARTTSSSMKARGADRDLAPARSTLHMQCAIAENMFVPRTVPRRAHARRWLDLGQSGRVRWERWVRKCSGLLGPRPGVDVALKLLSGTPASSDGLRLAYWPQVLEGR